MLREIRPGRIAGSVEPGVAGRSRQGRRSTVSDEFVDGCLSPAVQDCVGKRSSRRSCATSRGLRVFQGDTAPSPGICSTTSTQQASASRHPGDLIEPVPHGLHRGRAPRVNPASFPGSSLLIPSMSRHDSRHFDSRRLGLVEHSPLRGPGRWSVRIIANRSGGGVSRVCRASPAESRARANSGEPGTPTGFPPQHCHSSLVLTVIQLSRRGRSARASRPSSTGNARGRAGVVPPSQTTDRTTSTTAATTSPRSRNVSAITHRSEPEPSGTGMSDYRPGSFPKFSFAAHRVCLCGGIRLVRARGWAWADPCIGDMPGVGDNAKKGHRGDCGRHSWHRRDLFICILGLFLIIFMYASMGIWNSPAARNGLKSGVQRGDTRLRQRPGMPTAIPVTAPTGSSQRVHYRRPRAVAGVASVMGPS